MDTAEKSASGIAEYIRNQLIEDQMGEQMAMCGLGLFAGRK